MEDAENNGKMVERKRRERDEAEEEEVEAENERVEVCDGDTECKS